MNKNVDPIRVTSVIQPRLSPYVRVEQTTEAIVLTVRYGSKWLKGISFFFVSVAFLLTLLMVASTCYAIVTQSWVIIIPLLMVLGMAVALGYYWVNKLMELTNTITLTIGRDSLQRQETPLGGAKKNWHFKKAQIAGVYLKGKYYQRKSRTRYRSDDLLLRLHTGEEYTIFGKYFFDKPSRARSLETLIENYLDIESEPMPEEYQVDPAKRPRAIQKAARDKAAFDPLAQGRRPGERALKVLTPDLHLMDRRDIIVIKGQAYQVQQAWQYSWNNGQTDQWVQLQNIKGTSFGVYFEQNGGHYQPYYVELLTTNASNPDEDFPVEYQWENQIYEAQSPQIGQRHIRWEASGDWSPLQQCIYRSAEGQRLRLEKLAPSSALCVYRDSPIQPAQIEDFLIWVA